MKDSKEIMLRQYLLGKLDDREELEESWSRELFFNDELCEMAEIIEDEIIEEYLDGTLDPADLKAVEEYFMRPPERRKKLHFARLLRGRFADGHHELNGADSDQEDVAPALVTHDHSAFARRRHFRTGLEVFAVLLIGVSSFYVSRLQTHIAYEKQKQAQLAAQLEQEHRLSASLTAQLQRFQPPVANLALLFPGERRSKGSAELQIKPWTQQVHVDVALVDGSESTYNVSLETAGNQIWSAVNLPSRSGGTELVFDMPAAGIKAGEYSLTVSSKQTSFNKTFPFRAVAGE